MNLGTFLSEATATDAQLALSYLVWPGEAPDPRVVDEWLRQQAAERSWPNSGPNDSKNAPVVMRVQMPQCPARPHEYRR
jgi:hypothetical protein